MCVWVLSSSLFSALQVSLPGTFQLIHTCGTQKSFQQGVLLDIFLPLHSTVRKLLPVCVLNWIYAQLDFLRRNTAVMWTFVLNSVCFRFSHVLILCGVGCFGNFDESTFSKSDFKSQWGGWAGWVMRCINNTCALWHHEFKSLFLCITKSEL